MRVILAGILLATSCRGAPAKPVEQPTPVRAAATPNPPPQPQLPACPKGQITIESCVVGGMPIEGPNGPQASESCSTACTATPPAGSQGQMCERLAPDHYRCTAYAP